MSPQKKKETFACTTFGKTCYVACAINYARKLIYLRASLHECDRTGLIDKPITLEPTVYIKSKSISLALNIISGYVFIQYIDMFVYGIEKVSFGKRIS